ncbi:MAG: chemotaxis protein CheW [Proteobacteria bacterium]|nr:chemotaxis protein CheW [Pseudomonadota bacterium]
MEHLPTVVDSSLESTLRYVTFSIGEELFGVDIMCVESIIPPQTITEVPRTPDYFLGIINLRGDVISIIDMRKRFGLEPMEETPDTRIVVILTNGILVGMLVDRIASIESMAAGKLQKAPPMAKLEHKKFISSSFKLPNEKILLTLHHQKLIDDKDFVVEGEIKFSQEIVETGSKSRDSWVKEIPLVSFKIGEEHYTLESKYVEEIIFIPELTEVPDMEDLVDGIFYLRNSVVPVVRLGERLGSGKMTVTPDSQVIIIKRDLYGIKLGLIVDDISEIFFVLEDEIVGSPININKAQSEQLKGVFKFRRNDESLIIMLLELEKLFTEIELNQLRELEYSTELEETEQIERESTVGILEFIVADERYAIKVADTNEVIKVIKTVPVPKAPPYIKGIINLRGDVISIVEVGLLVDRKRRKLTKDARILIVKAGKESAGLLVSKVLGIRKVLLSSFEQPSDLIKQKGNIFIEGIGKIDESDDIVVLMDIETTLLQAQTLEEDEEELEEIRRELEFLEEEDEKAQLTYEQKAHAQISMDS